MKKATARHMIIKLLKTSDKDKILKEGKKKDKRRNKEKKKSQNHKKKMVEICPDRSVITIRVNS